MNVKWANEQKHFSVAAVHCKNSMNVSHHLLLYLCHHHQHHQRCWFLILQTAKITKRKNGTEKQKWAEVLLSHILKICLLEQSANWSLQSCPQTSPPSYQSDPLRQNSDQTTPVISHSVPSYLSGRVFRDSLSEQPLPAPSGRPNQVR